MSGISSGRRLLTTSLAAAAALALAVPALAQGAWDQHGADPGNTRQAEASGPAQPGLAWHLDVRSEGLTAGDGVGSNSNLNAPVIASDGTLVRRAQADGVDARDGGNRQVGIDPADGSVRWEIEGVSPSCAAASDSQGRLWVLLDDDADSDLDEPALEAYDPTSGEAHPGTRLELTTANGAPDDAGARWCDRTALHVGGTDGDERLVLFDQGDGGIIAVDVSGSAPSIGWAIGPDEATAPFDQVLRNHSSSHPRIGAFTVDELLVPTLTGDDDILELVALSLDDGGVAHRMELPSYDESGSPSTDPDLVGASTVEVLVHDGHAVAGLRTSGPYAALHGVDLSGSWDVPEWSQTIEARGTVGPNLMALSGSNVVHNVGSSMIPTPSGDILGAHDVATGAPTSWSYEHRVRSLGGFTSFELLTDVDGRIYTNTSVGPEQGHLAVTSYGTSGVELWSFTRASLADAMGLADIDDIPENLHLGAIDGDGTIYLHRDHHIIAIDGSGGLAEQRFGDVTDDHPFADEISWLTFEEITQGYADGTWRPGLDVGRQAVAAFFYRLAGEPEVTTTNPFPDVSTSHPFHDAIAWMTDEGITTGFDDGTFRPSADVTRQAAAAFLHRLDDEPTVTTDAGFTDVPSDHTFHDAIAWMVDEEVAAGYPDGTFRPTTPVTRQAVAAFVTRYATG